MGMKGGGGGKGGVTFRELPCEEKEKSISANSNEVLDARWPFTPQNGPGGRRATSSLSQEEKHEIFSSLGKPTPCLLALASPASFTPGFGRTQTGTDR